MQRNVTITGEQDLTLRVTFDINGCGGIELSSAVLESGVVWFGSESLDLDMAVYDERKLHRIGNSLMHRYRETIETDLAKMLGDEMENAEIRRAAGDDE